MSTTTQQMLEAIDAAILKVADVGERVELGDRVWQSADLAALQKLRNEWQHKLNAEIAATQNSRSRMSYANLNNLTV